ncbi:hypothetical protein EYC80_001876 [Monilinia laxa]|uniref:FAD/NAD(P)-binding domain-containing protein n=1 Tax=Monilinia laxa TaxID=61186 RepID=A0A5N6K726_MONLA|nr:hypothetical protein EYC80_001876 [Monilinia laxa]
MLLRRPASSLVRIGVNQSSLLRRSASSSFNQSTLPFSSQLCRSFSTNPKRSLTAITNQTKCTKFPRTQNIRFVSGKPLPQPRSKALNFLYRSATLLGGSLIILGVGVIGFFVYDATTYREDLSYSDISISKLALSPRRGGPKNLPIAEVQIDDDDSDEMQKQKDKPKLVILGGGWGSVALLKTLNPDDYHITLVSPTNYFLFTPMLPSATVGTLEFRSLVEPIRRIITRVKGHFIRATAEEIEFSEKLVELAGKSPDGKEVRFYLPYDKLVIGVGSTTNPHGLT